MRKLAIFVLLFTASLSAQTASISLSTSSPGTATVSLGSQEIGSLSTPVDITVTNNTGSTLTIYANYYVFTSSWPAGNGNFVQYDGDGMARSWARSDPSNTCITTTPATLSTATLANGASCHVYGYLTPTLPSSSGHIYFKDGTGTLLGTVTITATGTQPAIASPSMPAGINADGSGTVMDTSWPSTTGYTVTSVSTNLQSAIDSASCGTVLKLAAGTTFTLNGIIRNKGCDATHQILIMSSDCSETTGNCTHLPGQNTRICQKSEALDTCSPLIPYMATVQTANSNPAFLTECNASYYRLVGLQIKEQFTSTTPQQVLVGQVPSIGGTCLGVGFPNHIVFDRNYIHGFLGGSPEWEGNIFSLASQSTALINNVLWSDGGSNELQAIESTSNTAGPYKIVNNQLTHSGENFFLGGGDGAYIGAPMANVEVRSNWIYKPPTWNENCWGGWIAHSGVNPCGSLTWDFGNSPVTPTTDRGTWSAGTYNLGDLVYYGPTTCHYYVSQVGSNTATPGTDRTKWFCIYRQIKNGLELKKAHSILIQGNVIDGSWVGAQDGSIVLLECADQAGSDLQACVRDATIQYNIIRNGAFCLNGVSSSYAYPSESMQRVRFSNNLCYGITKATTGAVQSQHINNLGPGASQTANTHNQISGWNFFMDHNTWIAATSGTNAIYVYSSTGAAAQTNVHMTGNLWDPEGTFGILVNGSTGDTKLSLAFSNAILPKNLIVGADNSTYSSTNWVRPFPANDAAVRFSNTTNNDYRLCTGVGVPDASCVGASVYHNAAPDGLDYGADIGTINALTACTLTGCNPATGGSVTVSPQTATIPVSGTQQFSSTPSGATWSVNSGCPGSINSTSGVFTATTTTGSCTVTATVSASTGTATVVVQALTVTPSSVSLQVGATQQFTANFQSTWTASCGSITSSGFYTAPPTNGSCTITATAVNGGTTATATATVSGAPTFIPLSISPTSKNFGTVTSGTPVSQVFTASNIGTGSVTPTVALTGAAAFTKTADTCNATPVAGGGNCTVTIQFQSTPAGSFAGNLQITDTAGGNANIPLSATVAPATVVTVNPNSVTLPVLGTQQFTANVGVNWTASCGTITSAGVYTAPGTAQTCVVTATATDGSGSTANANVTAQTVQVSPVSVSLRVSALQQFTANFPVTWSATCGTITSFGLYTAPSSPTSCVVTATAQNGGSTGTAAVSVVPAPPLTQGGSGNASGNPKH